MKVLTLNPSDIFVKNSVITGFGLKYNNVNISIHDPDISKYVNPNPGAVGRPNKNIDYTPNIALPLVKNYDSAIVGNGILSDIKFKTSHKNKPKKVKLHL